MKKVLFLLVAFSSLSAMAGTLSCKPVNPDETIYNIRSLNVEIKAGTQKYLIREDKIAGSSYKTYLEESSDKVWTLNKYEVIDEEREDVLAQIDLSCSKS
ncbi:MAG: hypothetical protein ACOYL6_11590 [Bacteriovoracaceae bacterium]